MLVFFHIHFNATSFKIHNPYGNRIDRCIGMSLFKICKYVINFGHVWNGITCSSVTTEKCYEPLFQSNIKIQEIFVRNKEKECLTAILILLWDVISILLYSIECWTISSQKKRRLETTEMWFYRRILRILWMKRVWGSFKKNTNKKTLVLKLRKNSWNLWVT